MTGQPPKFSKKDFSSGLEVKWCAGCGDFAVLSSVQKTISEIGRPPEDFTFISGIGCSSRMTYYMSTYGFHTVHGRALTVATGAKIANPNQSVWVVTGDGDCLSIGGNHFMHAVRRNIDVVVVLLDNRIYGLTKGQYSPTSEQGKVTKSTPYGSVETPLDPVGVALSSGASFVARTTDRNLKLTENLLMQAYEHKGFSLVHILQNCNIFNDGAFESFTGKDKLESNLFLEDGKPLVFGKDGEKAIILDGFSPRVVNRADVNEDQILIHKEDEKSPVYAQILANLQSPEFPYPMGVIRKTEASVHHEMLNDQTKIAEEKKGKGSLEKLLNSGDTWEI